MCHNPTNMEMKKPCEKTAPLTVAEAYLFRPSTVSASQCPKVFLSATSGERSSIECPEIRLEIFGFLRERLLKTSESSNNVIGNSPAHNRLYKVFVQGISRAGNRCSRRARPTQVSNDQLCLRTMFTIQWINLESLGILCRRWQRRRLALYIAAPRLAEYPALRPRPQYSGVPRCSSYPTVDGLQLMVRAIARLLYPCFLSA